LLRSKDGKDTNLERLALSIFQLLNRAETQFEAIDRILKEIKDFLDVSATAIRLEDDGDYPYYFFDGFSDTHIEVENSLCNEITDEVAQLACMCGRVLMENTDPDFPFFTEGGSFWTNNTNTLLESATIEDLGETRNVCNTEGYLSVALIPLKSSEGVIGLLQLNDEAQDKFSEDLITYLEGIG
jgi:transcriptional regulator with GAF, ATPase, and Fis domain